MQYKTLGNTGIKVSELCFGALPFGPIQANIGPEEGGKLLRHAFENGVNFVDTAELYKTYPYIANALKGYDGEVVISSKSMAKDYKGMEKAIQEALTSLDRDVIDIFHIHAAREGAEVFDKFADALNCLIDYRKKGYIRAIGVATHNVKVTEMAAGISDIDVVFPLINIEGRGIIEGTREEMVKAINKCHKAGKGLLAMKALAGGNLIGDLVKSFEYVRNIEGIQSIAVGMVKKSELDLNLKVFNNEEISMELLPDAKINKKLYIFTFTCKNCGKCVEACPNGALTLGEKTAEVDHEKCLLCGYCYPACPEFAIRLV